MDQPTPSDEPGLGYFFSDTATIVSPEGYTFDLSFNLSVDGPIRVSTINDKPGQATLEAGRISVDAKLRNTTPGRRAPIAPIDYIFWAMYPAGHQACHADGNYEHVLTNPAGTYCSVRIVAIFCVTQGLELPPDGSVTCQPSVPELGRDPSSASEFIFPAWPEADLPALEADLRDVPPALFVLANSSGSVALDASRYKQCGFGIVYIVASGPPEIDCVETS